DEDFPFQPIAAPDFYARSKRLAEDVVREAATHRDLDVVALRPTVIYGERDRLFTPRVIRAARLRVLPQIGPGTNRWSCVYAGTGPGDRHWRGCTVLIMPMPDAFSWRWSWLPAWRPGPSSSPYRPSSCGTCLPSSYASYRTSSSWACRPECASSVSRFLVTRPP